MPSPDPQCGRLGATGTQPLTRNPSTPGASKISAWFITPEGGGWGKGRGVQNSHCPEASSYILWGDFSDFLVPAAAESAPCSAPRAHCPPLPSSMPHSTVMCVPVPHRWRGPWKQGHNLYLLLSLGIQMLYLADGGIRNCLSQGWVNRYLSVPVTWLKKGLGVCLYK